MRRRRGVKYVREEMRDETVRKVCSGVGGKQRRGAYAAARSTTRHTIHIRRASYDSNYIGSRLLE